MTVSQIEAAVERGGPFTILMSDGKEYHVRHRDYISISPAPTFVVVFGDEGHAFVLPLLTMTGLGYDVSQTHAAAP